MSLAILNKPVDIKSILICFHHSGGNANFFRMWSKNMAMAGIQLCGVNIERQTKFSNSNDPAARFAYLCKILLIPLIKKHIDSGSNANLPVVLFGHSLGALMAYEIARLMQEELNESDRITILNRFQVVVSSAKSPFDLHSFNSNSNHKFYHHYSDAELFDHVKSIGGLPVGVHPDFLTALLPAIKHDYAYYETYLLAVKRTAYSASNAEDTVPQAIAIEQDPIPPLEYILRCPIHSFGSAGDLSVTVDELTRWHQFTTSNRGGHRLFATGSHFYLSEPTHKEEFLQEIINICLR